MEHFIAYHSAQKMGYELESSNELRFYSRKLGVLKKSIGNTVWVIQGIPDGNKTAFYLCGVYVADRVDIQDPSSDLYVISGHRVKQFTTPVLLNGLSWFPALLKSQNNFSFGFNRLNNEVVVQALTTLQTENNLLTSHYPFCVYTIVSRDVLDSVAMERRPLIQTERKIWKQAKAYLNEASTEGSHVPVILGDAKDCSKLLYWGLLMRVGIDQSSTEYEVDRLRPIRDSHTPQELVLASSGKNIAPGFIRPYALCHTPAFLTESTATTFLSPEEGESPETYLEGAAIRVSVNAYERNAKARQKCIEHHGCTCAACGFDFEGTYGEIGRGFIHVHHVKPLSEIGAQYKVNPIQDLRPVCPNCHAMLHTQSPAMSIEELKALINR